MMKGLLLLESLSDRSVLDLLRVVQTETWQAQNATPYQPSAWTALSFEADDSQADVLAEQLSQALKPEGWYINAATDAWLYVVFPHKVFKYAPGDTAQRALAQQYAQSLNIPESQLDWGA